MAQKVSISSNSLSHYTKEQIKEKRKILEGFLRNYFEFRTLCIDEGIDTLTYKGESYCVYDLLDGFELLPARQRRAVELICILNYKEMDAAREMGFTRWSTPVQQYKNLGLNKLLAYHEERSKSNGAKSKEGR